MLDTTKASPTSLYYIQVNKTVAILSDLETFKRKLTIVLTALKICKTLHRHVQSNGNLCGESKVNGKMHYF